MKGKISSIGRVVIALVLVLSFSLVMAVPAAAANSITPVTPTDIEVGPAYTALTGLAIVEGAVADIKTGTIILTAPDGFAFDTTSDSVTATVSPGDLKLGPDPGSDTQTVTPTADTITIDVFSVSTIASTITYTGIKIRDVDDVSGTTGDLTFSGTAGVTGSAGTLTSVPGPHAAYTVEPAALTQTAGTAFDVTITAVDEFENTVAGIDNTLNGYTFTFSGPADAPDETQPTYGTMAAFSGGVSSLSVTLVCAETVALTVSDNQATPTTGTSEPITVNPASLDHLTVYIDGSPGAVTGTVGESHVVLVKSEDTYGNTVSTSLPIVLTATGDAVLGETTFNLSVGERTTTVTDTVAETVTVTALDASAMPIDGGSNTITFEAGTPVSLAIVPPSQEAPVATKASLSVQAQDIYGNQVGYASDIYLTVTGAAKITDVGSIEITPIAAHTITGFTGITDVKVTDDRAETVTVMATDLAVTPLLAASATITYEPGVAAKFVVTPAADAEFVAGTTVEIVAQIADAGGNPVAESGVTVNFALSGTGTTVDEGFTAASLSADSAVTDADGKASVTLTLATQAGKTHVVTASGTYTEEISGTFTTIPGSAVSLLVTAVDKETPWDLALDNRAKADFIEYVNIKATVIDQYGNMVTTPERSVSFETNLGMLTAATDDTSAGIATVDLRSQDPGVATVTASSSGLESGTAEAVFYGDPSAIVVTADPATVVADDATTSTITIQIVDDGGRPVDGAQGFTIEMSGTAAWVSEPTTTDDSGKVTGEITDSVVEAVTITVTSTGLTPEITGSTVVNFVADTAFKLGITHEPAGPVIVGTEPADGYTITVQVLDEAGSPVPTADYSITLADDLDSGLTVYKSSSDDGENWDSYTEGSSVSTSNSGKAMFQMISSEAEDVQLTAREAAGELLYAIDTVSFTYGVANSISLAASPTTVIADGETTSTITAQLLDANANKVLLPGVTITFTTALGIIEPSAVTDDEGKATTYLRSTATGKATIEAEATIESTTITGTGTELVTFVEHKLAVTASPSEVNLDQESTVTVQIKDALNKDVAESGVSITLTASVGDEEPSGTVTITTSPASTDDTGKATFTVKDDTAEILTLEATVEAGGYQPGSAILTVEEVVYILEYETPVIVSQWLTVTIRDNNGELGKYLDITVRDPSSEIEEYNTGYQGKFSFIPLIVGDYEFYKGAATQDNFIDTITVVAKALQSIAASPPEVSLDVGDTEQLTVTATYSDESTAVVTTSADCTYVSDNTTVATVTSPGGGLITAVAEGSATITVSYTEAGIEATDTVSVTVTVGFDPMVYDADGDGVISKTEALTAVADYFDGERTKEQALLVIVEYMG